jgi:hypothetical protein
MTCRQCGTEIADKALICYRCGTATSAPRVKPPDRTAARGGGLAAVLALVVLVVAGLLMGQIAGGAVPPEVGYALAALAALVLVWRGVTRRRS